MTSADGRAVLRLDAMSPTSEDAARVAFGRLTVGVAIVTTLDGSVPHGSTGMAWAEHADPPLVLTTLKASGRTRSLVVAAGAFAVNVLGEGQQELVRTFAARSVTPGDRFQSVRYTLGSGLGMPLLSGCVASLECRVRDVHPFGGHDIVVGEVVSTVFGSAERPVVHYDGRLWSLRRDSE